jgi:hypothetical protein
MQPPSLSLLLSLFLPLFLLLPIPLLLPLPAPLFVIPQRSGGICFCRCLRQGAILTAVLKIGS